MYPFAVLSGIMGGYIFPDNIKFFQSVSNHRVVVLDNGDLYVQGNNAGGAIGMNGPSGYFNSWTNMRPNCRLVATYPVGTAVITTDGKFIATGYCNYIGVDQLTYSFVDLTDKVFPAGGPIDPSKIKSFHISYNVMTILMENGDLYGMGTNTSRELGRSGAVTVPILLAKNVKKSQTEYRMSCYLTNDGKFFASGEWAGDLGYTNRNLTSFTQLLDADQDGRDTYIQDFNFFSFPSSFSTIGVYSISPTATGSDCMVYTSRGAFAEDTRPARPNSSLCRRVSSFTGRQIKLPHEITMSYDLLAIIDGVKFDKGQNRDGELGLGVKGSITTATKTNLPKGVLSSDIQFDVVDDAGLITGQPVGCTRYMIAKGALFCSGIIGNIDSGKPATTTFVQVLNMPKVRG